MTFWIHRRSGAKGLFVLLVVQLIGTFGVREPKWVILLSLLIGASATYAYARTEFVPTTLDVLSPAPVLFLILFLFFSPSTGLWLPGTDPENADVEASAEPPVVFVILDELPTGSLLDRPGHIDESLFPGFSELARRATWYENATTVADQTDRAIPAIVKRRNNKRLDCVAAMNPAALQPNSKANACAST